MTKLGTTAAKRVQVVTVAAVSLFAMLLLLPVGTATAAPPPLLSQFCETGSGAGQCIIPRGVATDPATGNIYVADQVNSRVNKFSPWGVFLGAWGWGVADGTSALQSCGPGATPPTTTCRDGLEGDGPGQFRSPKGVAVDSAGDIYVVDGGGIGGAATRVQKFDSDGNFLLMFGGGVDQGPNHPGNLCTAAYIAEGDTCGAASEGPGGGEFSNPFKYSLYGSYIAVGPGDKVYVGDGGRIQRFDTGGNHVESIPLPGETVWALTVDPVSGNLYVAHCLATSYCEPGGNVQGSKPNVLKLNPAGEIIETLPVKHPLALAVDSGGNLYAVDGVRTPGDQAQLEIRKFTSAGAEVPNFTFHDGFDISTGIATSSACGIAGSDLIVSNIARYQNSVHSVRAYGPPPNPEICPPPAVPPTIADQYAVSVDSDGATLKAEIRPNFWPDATYGVQYGTSKCSEGGCDREQPPAPGSKLTSAVTNQKVTTPGVFFGELEPNTTYYYRFVAQSSGGGPVRGVGGAVGSDGAEGSFTTFPSAREARTDCPNQAFRIGASAALPDCRAYEMVSPVDKNGGDVAAGQVAAEWGTLAKSSADGGRMTFSSMRSFVDPLGAPVINQYLSIRGADGWSTQSISPPRSNPPLWPPSFSGQFKAFDDDLCSAWLLQDNPLGLTPDAPPTVANLYQRDYCSTEAGYRLLSKVAPPHFGLGPGKIDPEFYLTIPQGFSADNTYTVFRADDELTSNACSQPGIFQVYLGSAEGPLRLVSALPNGQATCNHASVGNQGNLTDGMRESSVHNAVSADGSRVFWTDSGEASPLQGSGGVIGQGPGKLYVRINATQPQSKISAGKCTEAAKACTLPISTASNTVYWGADVQGTKAVYTVGDELFEFDVAEAKSQLIADGGEEEVVGVGEDASRIYFTSKEALSGTQENSEGEMAQAGKKNLYLYEGGNFTFIATLNALDAPGHAVPFRRGSRVTPDGLHLAFSSAEPLTGYDNTDLISGRADAEVYLYDATQSEAGELACISCNPTGARPAGRAISVGSTAPIWMAARVPGWPEQLRPSRLLSDDGRRLLFHSFEELVPGDTNGKQDVYEWQAATDAKACEEIGAGLYVQLSNGCLSLLSSGQSPEDAEVIDVSHSGGDVFIATGSSLLPQDLGLVDVYDARVNGGYPAPSSPPPACEGEACQGPLAPPDDPTPASSTFEGAGNVGEGSKKPRRCAKGKARRKGRCVAKKPQRKRANKRANRERRVGQ